MKLGTNIQHMSGHCREDSQGYGVKGQGHAHGNLMNFDSW